MYAGISWGWGAQSPIRETEDCPGNHRLFFLIQGGATSQYPPPSIRPLRDIVIQSFDSLHTKRIFNCTYEMNAALNIFEFYYFS